MALTDLHKKQRKTDAELKQGKNARARAGYVKKAQEKAAFIFWHYDGTHIAPAAGQFYARARKLYGLVDSDYDYC